MEYHRIEKVLFGSTSDHRFRDEEIIEYEDDQMEANARQIFGEALPDLQRGLLLANLSSQTLAEVKITQATNKAIENLRLSEAECGCSICIRQEICRSLRRGGYNSTICKSKWREFGIIGGEHTYIEVATKAEEGSKKKADARIIIELNFREEFMILRPTNEYKYLVYLLPKVFVGRAQKLRNLVKIMCSALELCMKKKKMHMGLWRTENYMQAKWQGRPQDSLPQELLEILPMAFEKRKPRSKLSLLTLQLSKT